MDLLENLLEEGENRLIFIPESYQNAVNIIEKLEFKDRFFPELAVLLEGKTVPDEENYNTFFKDDKKIKDKIKNLCSFKEILEKNLKTLKKRRMLLEKTFKELNQKKILENTDNEFFFKNIKDQHRELEIIDENIKIYKDILKRIKVTSFGFLGKHK